MQLKPFHRSLAVSHFNLLFYAWFRKFRGVRHFKLLFKARFKMFYTKPSEPRPKNFASERWSVKKKYNLLYDVAVFGRKPVLFNAPFLSFLAE